MIASVWIIVFAVLALLPLSICAFAASRDAIRGERRFGHRIFYAALLDVLVVSVFVAITLAILLLKPRAANVNFGIDWASLLFFFGFVFLFGAFTGSIGYAVSYRLFQQRPLNESAVGSYPQTPVDETGNPYQPPSR